MCLLFTMLLVLFSSWLDYYCFFFSFLISMWWITVLDVMDFYQSLLRLSNPLKKMYSFLFFL